MRESLKRKAEKRLTWMNNMVKKLRKKHPNADINTLREKAGKKWCECKGKARYK